TVGGLILWAGFLVLLAGIVGPWGEPLKPALIAVGAALALVGIVQDYRTIVPLRVRQAPPLPPTLSSIGASIILISLAQGTFGAQVSRFPPNLFPTTPYPLPANAVIAPVQVLVLGLALALMVGLQLLISRSQVGRSIRAIAWSERTARLLGIDVDLVVI